MELLSKLYNISKELTILYIEDDFDLQQKSTIIFSNLFKRVDVAGDGEEAIQKYEAYLYEKNCFYDLVISDLRMPKLDGVALVYKIFEHNKQQKIIITSAYSQTNDLIAFINLGVKKFIQKPFTMEQIVKILFDVVSELDQDRKNYEIILGENLFWNPILKELRYENNLIKLSFNEIVVLDALVSNPNKIFSNIDLFTLISENDFTKEFAEDSIKSIIKRLRRKIPYDIILNIYAQGYKLATISF